MSDSEAPVVVVATLQPKEGKEQALIDLFQELVPTVIESEPGTLRYAVHLDESSSPPRVVVIEKYSSAAAYQNHHDGLVSHMPRLQDILAGGIEAVMLTPLPITGSAGASARAAL